MNCRNFWILLTKFSFRGPKTPVKITAKLAAKHGEEGIIMNYLITAPELSFTKLAAVNQSVLAYIFRDEHTQSSHALSC